MVRVEVVAHGFRSTVLVDLDSCADAELGKVVRGLAEECAKGRAASDVMLTTYEVPYPHWRLP